MKELFLGQRYRTTEIIGSGGMADVYKAVDEVLGRTVAVKVMHAHLAAEPSFAARFRQEARAAASLTSANIVHMYDWGLDAETYYLVMEYVRGSDLKSMIEHRGALPSRMVGEIGAQVCCALSAAHGHDIIHRDIKPQNIMVQPDGAVKVMDFGIARTGTSMMTRTGSVLGTAQYLSPEQAQGRPLTAASDLYSLGITLYEAATGSLPFEADEAIAVALKQVNEQALPLHVVNPDVDPALERVIALAMRKDPAERYVSADDMRRDLLPIGQGNSVDAAAGLSGSQPRAAVDDTYGDAETAVMPLVPASAGSGIERHRRPRAAARKRRVWPWVAAALLLATAGLLVARTPQTGGTGTAVPRPRPLAIPAVEVAPPPIPNVVGMVEADAVAAIETAGFSPVALPLEFNQDAPAGTAYSQSPSGGLEAAQGSAVSYAISGGPEPASRATRGKKDKSNKGRDH